jgi:outer membrane usher protein
VRHARGYGLATLAFLISFAMTAQAAPAVGAAPISAIPDGLSLLVEARINGQPVSGLVGVDILSQDCTQIEAAPLKNAGILQGEEDRVCLQSVAGLEFVLDEGAARLDIYAARAPPRRRVTFEQRTYAKPLTGLVGGYGLSAQRVDDGTDAGFTAFGDMSLTLHTPHGRLQNDVVAIRADGEGRLRRIQTVYERDFPETLTRLSLGDTFTRAPGWGRIGALAGIQYGTDFSMDPDDSWRPYRTFQALLRQQSEVDVRVNGVLRQKQSVDPGFNDFQIAPEAGLNEVEVTIREAGGLSRIEDYSFFASPESLASGVTDYSVSVGVPRRFRGASSEYDDTLLASGLVRRGLSDAITAEAYSELGDGAGLLGGGGQVIAEQIGVLSLSAGMSRNEAGETGRVVSAGFERNTRRGSLQVRARFADPDYADAASARGAAFPDRSIRASGGVYTKAGSFRAAYVDEADKVLRDRRFLSVEWEKPFRGDRFSLSASAFQDFARDETGLAVTLRASFGAYNAGGGYQTAGGRGASSVQLGRARQPGERTQWAVRAAEGDAGTLYQGDLVADLGTADILLNGGVFGETSQLMAGARGGFVWMPGRVSMQRQTTGASALVRMPELEGVPIYKDNRVVATIGENGLALIPDIRPYEINTLRLRPEDIPLDFQVGDFTTQFIPRRGLSEVVFDVRRQTALAFTIETPGGAPLPSGSRAELLGSGLACLTGLEGRVYCSVAEDSDTLAVTTPAGRFVAPVSEVRASGKMLLRPETRLKLAGIG